MTSSNSAVRHQQQVYKFWAPVYDSVYRRMLGDAHRRLAGHAAGAGPDILEVGVGTGLVLRHYPPETRVHGIDVSAHMIAKAREKVEELELRNVRSLEIMDAQNLEFPDESFDAVTLPFVLTLVPDAEAALDECARILRPGGEIVIVSKISDSGPVQSKIETALAPVAHMVGWSTSFRLSRIYDWAASRENFEVIDLVPLAPGGFFKLVRVRRKDKAARSGAGNHHEE